MSIFPINLELTNEPMLLGSHVCMRSFKGYEYTSKGDNFHLKISAFFLKVKILLKVRILSTSFNFPREQILSFKSNPTLRKELCMQTWVPPCVFVVVFC